MTITEITIPFDTDTARVYQDASTEDQKKLRLILSLWLREYGSSLTSLNAIMNGISEKAQTRGLTPEILETLLHAD